MRNFEWTHRASDRYLVIGRLVSGQRFRIVDQNPYVALYRNLWNGRVWLIRDGKRILVKVVTP